MQLLSTDTYTQIGHSDKTYEEFVEDLEAKYKEGSKFTVVECDPNMPELTTEYVHQRKYRASWCRQFGILFHRATTNCIRLLGHEFVRVITVIVIGLCMMAIYYKVISLPPM